MILNDVEKKLNKKLKKRKNKTKAVENYLKIVKTYLKKHVNEAKAILRSRIFRMMSEDWIFLKALHANFRHHKRESRIVLEKYMIQFKKELKSGAIKMNVNKKEI